MMTRPSSDSIDGPFLAGVEMAGDAALVAHLSPLRIDGAADRHDMRAARVEVAAWRRVDRRRHLALDAQHPHPDLPVRHPPRVPPHLRIGIQPPPGDIRDRPRLDDA